MTKNEKAIIYSTSIATVLCCLWVFINDGFAAGWVGKKNFNPNDLGTVWTRQADCERANPEGCFDLPDDFNASYYKTTYKAKTDSITCSGEEDCKRLAATPCPDKTKSRVVATGYKEVYCTKALRIARENSKKQEWERKQVEQEKQLIRNASIKDSLRKRCVKWVRGNGDLTAAQVKQCLQALL